MNAVPTTLTVAGHTRSVPNAVKALVSDYPVLTVQHYDHGLSSPPNEVTPTDLGRLIVIEPLWQKVAINLLKVGSDAPWSLVPEGSCLADANPEPDPASGAHPYKDATDLFEYFDSQPKV